MAKRATAKLSSQEAEAVGEKVMAIDLFFDLPSCITVFCTASAS